MTDTKHDTAAGPLGSALERGVRRHTPGPWVYDIYNQPNGERAKITTVAHCCDYVIGLPSTYPGGNYRDGDPSGDPEADARLIAAAPDLLALLEKLCALNAKGVPIAKTWGAAEDLLRRVRGIE